MNNECRIIYLKDKNMSDVSDIFSKLEQNNKALYRFVCSNLQKDASLGVREDVLQYISGVAEQFGTDQRFLFQIAGFMNNLKITPEHLEWADSFLKKNTAVDVDDFSVVFIEAVEKDIPLQQIKKLFDSETDQLLIYQKIVDYEPETFNETADEVPESDNDVNSLLEIPNQGDGAKKIDDKECDKQEDSGYAEMFNSLITVMSIKKDGDNSARTVSDNLNKIVAKFQLAASELAAYSSEVVHEVENDKEEIKRLNALLNLQQRVMSSQQNKINEMRGEIVRLNTRIQNAERTEMRREAINQKISELQSLTLNERKDSENAYSYLEG